MVHLINLKFSPQYLIKRIIKKSDILKCSTIFIKAYYKKSNLYNSYKKYYGMRFIGFARSRFDNDWISYAFSLIWY
jgi:hypothetical protein